VAKKFITIVSMFVLLALLLSGALPRPAVASPDWLSGWTYRKSHIINSAAGAGINYQLRFIVNKGSGTDADCDVYLSNHCRDDFGDIRFTGSDGTTELDYWMESYTSGDKATFWVEVTDDLSSSNATIYTYYGNTGALTTSNGANTFTELFTDFPGSSLPSGWEVDGDTVGSMVIENSLLKLTARKEASGSWLKRGVKTSSTVWANDRALMYRIDSINYYPAVTDRRRWFLGGEGGNYYLEFQSFGDKIRVRDFDSYDEYSPCDFTGGKVIWLAKESGNDGVAYFYVDGSLVDTLDNGLNPSHAFSNFTVVFNVQVGSNAMPDVDYTYIDWVSIRKFVYPEPANGVWGSEEEGNHTPDQPADLGPAAYVDGGWVDNNTPTLEFTQSDPDGDTVSYNVQIDDDDDFSSPAVVYTSALLAQGAASFTSPSLPDGDYYWRVMSTDEHGATRGWTVANGGEVAFRLNTATEAGQTDKDTYLTSQDVEVSATGFPPDSEVDVYVVEDYHWYDGDLIPPDLGAIFAQKTFTTDNEGEIENEVIWEAPLEIGEYDVVFDADRNGVYDEIPDLIDDPNHPGLTVVAATVGGTVYPVDKASLLLPWLGLGAVLIMVASCLIMVRRRSNK